MNGIKRFIYNTILKRYKNYEKKLLSMRLIQDRDGIIDNQRKDIIDLNHKIGAITKQYEDAAHAAMISNNANTLLHETISKQAQDLIEAEKAFLGLKKEYDRLNVEVRPLVELQEENEKLKTDLKADKDFYETLYASVNDGTVYIEPYAFDGQPPFPGSTNMISTYHDTQGKVEGRSILTEEETKEFNSIVNPTERYRYAYEILKSRNIANNILNGIIKAGGMAITVGYDKGMGCIILYYIIHTNCIAANTLQYETADEAKET